VVQFLREFFVSKQSFQSAMGDLLGAAALLSATPDGLEMVQGALGAWGPLALAFSAYLGGAVSGYKTSK
jgi:hypothetical protein